MRDPFMMVIIEELRGKQGGERTDKKKDFEIKAIKEGIIGGMIEGKKGDEIKKRRKIVIRLKAIEELERDLLNTYM